MSAKEKKGKSKEDKGKEEETFVPFRSLVKEGASLSLSLSLLISSLIELLNSYFGMHSIRRAFRRPEPV
jgi:hypothetical protein